ncbi:MAG: rhodanese-like domain-containing protein [Gammaproteobacteria bacterium]|nr:rhodanese-like domain-containing protein [Gammaproteobacteria bacterium]
MKTFNDLINDALPYIKEVFPWDLEEKLEQQQKPLVLDIREPDEYDAMHIEGSMFVPRGILEQACEWDYDETVPELVTARDREIVVVCRSGTRSVMAAFTMHLMGYQNVASLKTGVRGWNDYEQPLVDNAGNEVDIDEAEEYLANKVRDDQMNPDR